MSDIPRLVVFDCDGTLVDSQHLIVTAMTRAFDAHGVALPDRQAILSIVGLSLPEAVAQLVPDAEMGDVHLLSDAYKAAFKDLRQEPDHHEPLYPGARETVEALAGEPSVLLGVATGKSLRGLEFVLGHHGLREHFFTLHTADDGPSKPHPHMLEEAMRTAGVPPGATVMIGDTTFDMQMAKSAGARSIAVAWGYHGEAALRGVDPDHFVTGFEDVLPAIESVFGKREAEPVS
ncbi:MAG: HAD-IA family hydrolase [Hyphomicrobiales bacterium]|nr:HAD-IA family hydrolase [Hyphomicrobiales bacterium]